AGRCSRPAAPSGRAACKGKTPRSSRSPATSWTGCRARCEIQRTRFFEASLTVRLFLTRRPRVAGENPFLHGLALDQVPPHELRDALGAHAGIPRPLGVDDHGRAVAADAQAADLGAVAGALAGGEVVLLDLRL